MASGVFDREILSKADAKNEERRLSILLAAEQVFTQKGFEGATMQDVAGACGMSPGNLYRYFGSKAALISGLVERDRNEMAVRFAELSRAPDQLAGFERLGRTYLKDEAKRSAKLTLIIWAASVRLPELAAPCRAIECAVTENLLGFLERVKTEGAMAPYVDHGLVAHLVMSLAQSFLRDVALVPDYDQDRALDIMFATVRAALSGHIQVPPYQET
jgi:TetR/AcrR family transcriptional regulator, repressor for uid operon